MFLTLAALALLMKIALPPGLMAAAPGQGAGFPLVICTGHGPLTLGLPDHSGSAGKSRSDAPCAFAGHAAPPAPAIGAPLAGAIYSRQVEPSHSSLDLTPGRGLAAPPPPSQAPPAFL